MRAQQMMGTRTWLPLTGAALVTVFAAEVSLSQQPRPTPKADFASVDSSYPTNRVLQAYFQRLLFLSDHVSSDERPLDSAGVGPVARLEPEAGVHLLRESDLREGRVLARIVNAEDRAFPRLGVAPRSITYWWVKYVGDRPVGVMISTNAATGEVLHRWPVGIRLPDLRPHPKMAQPVARFLWSRRLGVYGACSACPEWGWCPSDTIRSRAWR